MNTGVRVTIALAAVVLLSAAESAAARPGDAIPRASAIVGHATAAEGSKCRRERSRVARFERSMRRKRRAYHRAHRSLRARRAFDRRQQARLRRLRRALKRCQRRPGPALIPSPVGGTPVAAPVDTTPPELTITSPSAGTWFTEPSVTVRGTVADAAGVTCNDGAAALDSNAFACDVALVTGTNTITVAARDGAGNTSRSLLLVGHAAGGVAGAGASAALDGIHDFDGDDVVAADEIAEDGIGRRVARTKLQVSLAPEASVEQVNTFLIAHDATITSMLAGVAIVVVRVPDPGSIQALEAIAESMRADPIVRAVDLAPLLELDDLPPNYAGLAPTKLAHHIAVRAPNAWNARAALHASDRPLVVVGDAFGGGQPNGDLDVDLPLAVDLTGSPDEHGYHVAGIIAATFAGDTGPRGLATGIFPARTRMEVVDSKRTGLRPTGELDFPTFENLLLDAVRRTAGNVVVSTSANHCDRDGACTDPTASRNAALRWIEKVRGTGDVTSAGAGLERRFLHFTSAGNIGGPISPSGPHNNSPWAAAAMFPGLTTGSGSPVPHLTNTLVIENAVGSGATHAQCLSATSKRPGHLSAIGTNVWSLMDASSTAGERSGTSMATPQAAGLAAMLWTLDPAMTPQQLARLMTRTSDSTLVTGFDGACDAQVNPQPLIDAYTSVLATDAPTVPTPGGSPVRQAIMNVNDSGASEDRFDEADLADFKFVYFDDAGPVQPTSPDYGRFDLNGDGFAGAPANPASVPFDLDPTGTLPFERPQHSQVTRLADGETLRFNETRVSDLNILCFYAYSPLYVGSPSARSALRPKMCPPSSSVKVEISPAGATLRHGQSFQFTAVVTGTDNTAVVWSADGGTINQAGMFTATGTADPQYVRVEARSLDDPSRVAQVVVRVGSITFVERGSHAFVDIYPTQDSDGDVQEGVGPFDFDGQVELTFAEAGLNCQGMTARARALDDVGFENGVLRVVVSDAFVSTTPAPNPDGCGTPRPSAGYGIHIDVDMTVLFRVECTGTGDWYGVAPGQCPIRHAFESGGKFGYFSASMECYGLYTRAAGCAHGGTFDFAIKSDADP